MINYTDGQLTDLLPASYSDPRVQALSYAVKQGLSALEGLLESIQIYKNTEDLADDVLKLWCQELRLPEYDTSWTSAQKAAAIEGSAEAFRSYGTMDAVKALAESVLGTQCRIEEWYDYNDSVYAFALFKIYTQDTPSADAIADFENRLARVKPARCQLVSISTEPSEP